MIQPIIGWSGTLWLLTNSYVCSLHYEVIDYKDTGTSGTLVWKVFGNFLLQQASRSSRSRSSARQTIKSRLQSGLCPIIIIIIIIIIFTITYIIIIAAGRSRSSERQTIKCRLQSRLQLPSTQLLSLLFDAKTKRGNHTIIPTIWPCQFKFPSFFSIFPGLPIICMAFSHEGQA